jgi:hypothetical protein
MVAERRLSQCIFHTRLPIIGAIFSTTLIKRHERVGVLVMSLVTGTAKALKTHKYAIGQNVRYTAGPFTRAGSNGSFTVVKLLPTEGDENQYRIKSVGEAFERVAKESQLDRDH